MKIGCINEYEGILISSDDLCDKCKKAFSYCRFMEYFKPFVYGNDMSITIDTCNEFIEED